MNSKNENYFNKHAIAGADESGAGDYFGPLVVAAVYIPANKTALLKQYNIRDSKKISDKKVLELAAIIKRNAIFTTFHLWPVGCNKLKKCCFNHNELKTFLFLKTINALEQKYYRENRRWFNKVIIDKFADDFAFEKYQNKIINKYPNFKLRPIKSPVIFEVRAEQLHISVAAASIVARAEFLFLLQRMTKDWRFEFLKGASLKVIERAKEFVKKHGQKRLDDVAKTYFKTTKKVLED